MQVQNKRPYFDTKQCFLGGAQQVALLCVACSRVHVLPVLSSCFGVCTAGRRGTAQAKHRKHRVLVEAQEHFSWWLARRRLAKRRLRNDWLKEWLYTHHRAFTRKEMLAFKKRVYDPLSFYYKEGVGGEGVWV